MDHDDRIPGGITAVYKRTPACLPCTQQYVFQSGTIQVICVKQLESEVLSDCPGFVRQIKQQTYEKQYRLLFDRFRGGRQKKSPELTAATVANPSLHAYTRTRDQARNVKGPAEGVWRAKRGQDTAVGRNSSL